MDTASVDHFFSPEGPLAGVFAAAGRSYEVRPEQQALARSVCQAILEENNLLAEAGTGTGKTLAYLVPALACGLKVVVSTGTKALQDQLLNNDLPLLRKAAGVPLPVAVLKGRSNYLCEARFESVAAQPTLRGMDGGDPMDEVANWRQQTQTGERTELARLREDAVLWSSLSATAEQCIGRKCDHFQRCWVTQARRRAQEADLVVVNHHLYLADAALRQRHTDDSIRVLPEHDVVIFDEADDLDEVATQHFGCEISDSRIRELGREVARVLAGDRQAREHVATLIGELELRTRHFFSSLPFEGSRVALPRQSIVAAVCDAHVGLSSTLAKLERFLAQSAASDASGLVRSFAQLSLELAFALYREPRFSLFSEGELPHQSPMETADAAVEEGSLADGFVRFTEWRGRTKAIVARPLDVAPMLRRALQGKTAIAVSATLAVGKDFRHAKRRLGMEEANELLVASPLFRPEQVHLYVAEDLPEPSDRTFPEHAASRVVALLQAAGGGAFVLCTSIRMVTLFSEVLQQRTEFAVLTQGEAPSVHLVERFRDHGNAVLVATMGFWRGVDVPGSALRLVVIDRLPFASPGDPLVAARLEYLQQTGHSPFGSYQLPHAALLLRQGFGRLIRQQSDHGMVAILDRRIVTKGYGRVFVRSLPECKKTQSLGEATAVLADLVSRAKGPWRSG